MTHPHYTKEEIAARGKAIYDNQLRAQLEPAHTGKYLVIDIETGEYEIDSDGSAASLRAFQKKPEGVRYGMRIGYPAWGRIGARSAATPS